MTAHQFNFEHADKLLSNNRKESLPVEQIIEKMGLRKHDIVADLGAGNGYFTLPIAKYTEKTVYAVDIEPRMLELLRNRTDDEQMDNIHEMTAQLDNTPIHDQSVDKVLVSQVIHEVPSLENALKEIKRILKPDGILFLIEFYATESSDGPPLHIRIPPEKLTKILQEFGFSTTVFEMNTNEYAIKAKIDPSDKEFFHT